MYYRIALLCLPFALLAACAPQEAPASRPDLGPSGVLLLCQAQFITGDQGAPVPGPARLELVRVLDGRWDRAVLEDPLSNVFHKAMIVISEEDTALFTIGGNAAALTRWKTGRIPSEPERIWQPVFGGKHNRVRDIERGDVDGDGLADWVMATHDQGVVAVARRVGEDWEIVEVDGSPDTFVHEIEIGDADGDGQVEFYATPSKPNRASGESQAGAVLQYAWDGQRWARAVVDSFADTHAKEILVADLDGTGDALYVVKEAVISPGVAEPLAPVSIVRYRKTDDQWRSDTVATIPDRQCRFLLATDLDGNNSLELVAAGFKTGLWWIKPGATVPWQRELIDGDSSGFEHACTSADMDGDGTEELYVAADDQKELRRYVRRGGVFQREAILPLTGDVITWGLTAGRM
ncbi:VCBS repeat-containing protein [Candidatus Fermentibacteria bacterium]|nr:VCBS repeat-containing protein [Candidatus Fermentibacteria bacterium]